MAIQWTSQYIDISYHTVSGDKMKQIMKQFKTEKHNSVSSIIERVKMQLQIDKSLRKQMNLLS